MGCGCNKRKRTERRATSYELQMPDGTKSDHDSALEAQAQNVRAGGGGKVRETVKA